MSLDLQTGRLQMLVQPQKVIKKKPQKTQEEEDGLDELIICLNFFENKKLLTSL